MILQGEEHDLDDLNEQLDRVYELDLTALFVFVDWFTLISWFRFRYERLEAIGANSAEGRAQQVC